LWVEKEQIEQYLVVVEPVDVNARFDEDVDVDTDDAVVAVAVAVVDLVAVHDAEHEYESENEFLEEKVVVVVVAEAENWENGYSHVGRKFDLNCFDADNWSYSWDFHYCQCCYFY